MAILKHISSKNANYGDAEKYLTFEHDEFTMKPTLDADGRLIPRVDYRISSLNCGGEDFAVACMRSNLRYGKNQKREDVKSHHYIISFDPRDGPDNGLTVDRAQELGEKFCAEHFPGHQALVCTHPDGHSHTENIHVHIVINSLRIAEVPMLPHMDRPADRKAGCKHRCTDAAMNYLKAEVMEMCHSEGLYQIDLLNGSKERITEREYWAQKKGQAALDRANAPIAADGIAPRQTKFETDKAKLRRTIREALAATEGERKRRARLALQEQKALPQTGADKCPPYRADICPPEIEIEKEIDIEIEKERELETGHPAPAAYGRYHNVILSDTELDGLKTELPGKWEYYIDRLSCHIASSGRKYKSHAATIFKWAQEDAAKKAPKKGIPDYTCKEGESL